MIDSEWEPKSHLLEINITSYLWKAIVLCVKCNNWNFISASLVIPGIKWKPTLCLLRPFLLFESLYGYMKESLMKWIIDIKTSKSNMHFRFSYCVRGVLGVQLHNKSLFFSLPLFFACFFFLLFFPHFLQNWDEDKERYFLNKFFWLGIGRTVRQEDALCIAESGYQSTIMTFWSYIILQNPLVGQCSGGQVCISAIGGKF